MDEQCQWMTRDVCEVLYRTGSAKLSRKRLRDSSREIAEVHKQIWPFVPCPTVSKKHRHGENTVLVSTLPTSYLFATLVFMFRATKRAPEDRQMAARILRFFLDKMGPGYVDVLRHDPNNNLRSYDTVTVDSDGYAPDVFSREFREQLGLDWDLDLMSATKPWVSSTREKPLLSDYVLYCLDPAPANCTRRSSKR